MKHLIALSFLSLACTGDLDFGQEATFPEGCNQPEAYTATYTKTSGDCGSLETESFAAEDTRTWFPLALDLDDCVRETECLGGILRGTSSCTRTVGPTSGTLDAALVFNTAKDTGTLDLTIIATSYHGTKMCKSTYDVTYDAE